VFDDLPVSEVITSLSSALATSRNAVLVAPPGAGKTTSVPLRLIDEPWLDHKKIVMLEPRRLAARAAARRMAHLLGEDVGETVGFVTRDERKIGPLTRIEVVTEGVLTRRLQNDPTLEGVGLVIFDEIHERNVPTDLGLTFLLDARTQLSLDVRILAMSATPEAEAFARVIGTLDAPAPIITSQGRMFDVEIRYVPRQRNDRLEHVVASTVMRALREDEGDILIFLPGIGEINRAKNALESQLPAGVAVHRLAGALPFAEQDLALAPSPSGQRRVVLSTDIAETSLTVDGIHIVIDAGLSRVPRLDVRTGLTELTTVFLDTPPAKSLSRAIALLRTLHLVDSPPASESESISAIELPIITELGRDALSLPIHPRLAVMVLHVRNQSEQGWLACVIAALLEERDILRSDKTTPIDLALRVRIVLGLDSHDGADRGGVARVRERAKDLARRARISSDVFVSTDLIDHYCGALLLRAYPDRLAMRRSTPGQFITYDGGGAWCDTKDVLAQEQFLVAADLDADRKSSRIRRAAALDADQVAATLGEDLIIERDIVWDKSRNDLVQREVRRVGSLRLGEYVSEPLPCDDTLDALIDRVRVTQLDILNWSDDAESLRQRMLFLRHHCGEEWPDVSRKTLLASVDSWLRPFLAGATSRSDLERLDMAMLLRSMLSWDQSEQLDTLAPARYQPPTGKPIDIDYTDISAPSIDVRVQKMFGVTSHPHVLNGSLPLKVVLLSPADYPIQVTSHLPDFWNGSWRDVRREMAGRYPKHSWPEDPCAPSTF